MQQSAGGRYLFSLQPWRTLQFLLAFLAVLAAGVRIAAAPAGPGNPGIPKRIDNKTNDGFASHRHQWLGLGVGMGAEAHACPGDTAVERGKNALRPLRTVRQATAVPRYRLSPHFTTLSRVPVAAWQ